MTTLIVSPEHASSEVLLSTTDDARIAEALAAVGVEFRRWRADAELAPDATDDDVLGAYREEVRRLADAGYTTVDVARMVVADDDPERATKVAAARGRFLAEHRHADDEVRFFVEGSGAFYLRLDGKVHAVVCEAGDYISVPAGTRHWFDMGTSPRFTAIRFFRTADGWVGDFTGDEIAAGFPTFDELAAAGAGGPAS